MTGRRGGKGTAAARRHLSSNHRTSTAAQEEPEDESRRLLLLYKDALCNKWLRKISCLANTNSSHSLIKAIRFPGKAAVHAPVMSVITQNKIQMTNVSILLNDLK